MQQHGSKYFATPSPTRGQKVKIQHFQNMHGHVAY